MIQIQQIKLKNPAHRDRCGEEILQDPADLEKTGPLLADLKRSLDARRKPELFYVYTVEAEVDGEQALQKAVPQEPSISCSALRCLNIPIRLPAREKLSHRPVIVGTGPGRAFLRLRPGPNGVSPHPSGTRGAPVEERKKDVEEFWKTGCLRPESNVQFGEGGAGTFSDGKLNTLVHDPDGRGREVLRLFASHGAPEEILYDSKPHWGQTN